MELTVVNIQGKKTSKKVKLNEAIFGIEPNDHAIYLDVKQILANRRQGTSKAKERNEIKGSTKKLRKQKGGGGARVGSINNPLFRGGGRVFGPEPRNYINKLNKKVSRLARISALAHKAKDNQLTVLEDFSFDNIKTKQYADMLKSLNVDGRKSLLVIDKVDKNILLSARNLQNAQVVQASDINTYDILNAKGLLVTESSLKAIDNLLSE
ncbi:MAG: 50S ribosomal protein L4 [Flavobacteriales bacterium]|nr:50S ribosomal protein L4 [Flavobacteriales bacterium]MCB9447064.1 50S ribosomal protein L4 [Flavobacteriales bacterium]